MKRFMSVVLSMVVVLMMCDGAMAEEFYAQGGALVPNIRYIVSSDRVWMYPEIVLTNITNDTVQCQVRVYDADGLDLTSRGAAYKGGTTSTVNIGAGGNFEIPPHSSRMYVVLVAGSKINTLGHAEIQWMSSDSKARKALIGGGTIRKKNDYRSDTSFLINQGNPF